MAPPAPVIIAGGGIGGLTLALALARRGIAARVLERAAAPAEVGAGLQLTPNGNRILDALGLTAALDVIAVEPDGARLFGGIDGRLVATVPLGEARRRWGAPYRLLHRADLHEALRGALIAAGGSLTPAHEVTDFAAGTDCITVGVEGGTEVHGSVLVGADGLFSTVRRSLGDRRAPLAATAVAWRALVPAAAWPAAIARAGVSLWLGPGGHLVAYPLRRGALLNVVVCIPGRVGGRAAVDGDPRVLRDFFACWAPAVRALAAATDAWTVWPLFDRPAGHFPGHGAVTLIGDAAHPALPHLAQGAAMAIEDAAVLAARLAASPGDIEGALRGFEQTRRARVSRVQAEARDNGRIYTLGPLAARARDTVLRVMGPDRLMRRLDWLYGWTP